MKIEVVTRDLADLDQPPHVKIIDDENREDRMWLSKHAFWALRNKKSVTTRKKE